MTFFAGRSSDSPYIHGIWHGQTGADYAPVCPADGRWNLLFQRRNGKTHIWVEGPLTGAKFKTQDTETEFLVIRFALGTYMPFLPVGSLLNDAAAMPERAGNSFWLNGTTWEMPTFENMETFVDRLVRKATLISDPVVTAVLNHQPLRESWSFRTVRRRFLYATGLTYKSIQQIERAQHAAALLEQGVPILDVAYQVGYADQPHMTRSLRRYIGFTPAQIARTPEPTVTVAAT